MAFEASRQAAQLIMQDKPIMELKTQNKEITSVNFDLQIDQSDMAFFHEIIRRMGNIALVKVLRYKYPFMGLGQASDLAHAIRNSLPKDLNQ